MMDDGMMKNEKNVCVCHFRSMHNVLHSVMPNCNTNRILFVDLKN